MLINSKKNKVYSFREGNKLKQNVYIYTVYTNAGIHCILIYIIQLQ